MDTTESHPRWSNSARRFMTTRTSVYCRPEAFAAFAAALDQVDTSAGLFRAAFAIAQHERPHAEFQAAAKTIDGLAQVVRRRVHSDRPQARLAHLHDVLFDVVGLRGNEDDYYHPDNSYVGEVLRTRRGIPISLVLIYKLVAEQVDLCVHGINSPGHFLAGVEFPQRDGGERATELRLMYVDPFYGGGLLHESEAYQRIEETTGRQIVRTPQLLARASHRQWLERMLNNLQATFASMGRDRDVCAMQELQLLL
jgi:regulator of sirC expression with transglutaminase-like and TPR domain